MERSGAPGAVEISTRARGTELGAIARFTGSLLFLLFQSWGFAPLHPQADTLPLAPRASVRNDVFRGSFSRDCLRTVAQRLLIQTRFAVEVARASCP